LAALAYFYMVGILKKPQSLFTYIFFGLFWTFIMLNHHTMAYIRHCFFFHIFVNLQWSYECLVTVYKMLIGLLFFIPVDNSFIDWKGRNNSSVWRNIWKVYAIELEYCFCWNFICKYCVLFLLISTSLVKKSDCNLVIKLKLRWKCTDYNSLAIICSVTRGNSRGVFSILIDSHYWLL
jgi:hypothetical protein